MVLQINRHLVYNAYIYILPESSQWSGVLEKEPCEALAASLNADFQVSKHGDLNARTGSGSKVAYRLAVSACWSKDEL